MRTRSGTRAAATSVPHARSTRAAAAARRPRREEARPLRPGPGLACGAAVDAAAESAVETQELAADSYPSSRSVSAAAGKRHVRRWRDARKLAPCTLASHAAQRNAASAAGAPQSSQRFAPSHTKHLPLPPPRRHGVRLAGGGARRRPPSMGSAAALRPPPVLRHPPPLLRCWDGEPDAEVLAEEVRRRMRLSIVEALRRRLGDGEVIPYADLLCACEDSGAARMRAESAALAGALDEAGVVLLFRDKVCLQSDKEMQRPSLWLPYPTSTLCCSSSS
ncbi:hypothetical protein EJB05_20181, partial [Eragrostis curvula]